MQFYHHIFESRWELTENKYKLTQYFFEYFVKFSFQIVNDDGEKSAYGKIVNRVACKCHNMFYLVYSRR